ncbi:hypothetical protein K490DRAFT_44666 [Saccharata proteae CBS 121410]|uniref:Aminoglycoside phosphotransferase domain-containing protein n=1 Tax=Saccharata proteae CBS 121410 TaxID=1314787 RepID=A0A9P4HW84_9PEZI|nr:hypothetical protein K490DRAFT_44666 [Saccharata proteae CBS 121410]
MEKPFTAFPFFARNGFTELDRISCDLIASRLYPDDDCQPHQYQGYCSYTILATPKPSTAISTLTTNKPHILQFRPSHYALNPLITTAAAQIYGSSAPETNHLGPITLNPSQSSANETEPPTPILHLHDISIIPGIPYSTALITHPTLTLQELHRQQNLIISFAAFLARAWPTTTTASSPPAPFLPQGKVFPNITTKLQGLTTALPTPALCARAAEVLQRSERFLVRLPNVLTHGDIVPSNLMIDVDGKGRLEGMVDWAEAEGLPFGTCCYGLEFLLGWVGETAYAFTYYTAASRLRGLFWNELARLVPALREQEIMEAVRCARDVGVLLWFGYAWDEGSIDRVVDEVRDRKEVVLLETFLGLGKGSVEEGWVE